MAELVDALDLGSSGETRESSSLSFRTITTGQHDNSEDGLMDVLVENTSNLGRRIKVSVPDAEVKAQIRERMAKLSREVKLKGFRPGKVPLNVVQEKFGSSVRSEVIQNIVQSTLEETVKKHELTIAGRPSIESLASENDQNLEFVATFEIYPQITLNPFSALSIEKRTADITDQDIQKMLDKLLSQQPEGQQTIEALIEKLHLEGGEAALRDQIRNRLQQEADSVLREEVKEKVLEQLLENNRFELPESLITQEKEAIHQEMARGAQSTTAPADTPEAAQEIEEAARKRVELGLLLNEVIKKFAIKPDSKRIQEHVLRLAFSYAKPAEIIEAYQKNSQLRFSVERMVLLEQAVDAILGEMQVTETKVPFEELMNQAETV